MAYCEGMVSFFFFVFPIKERKKKKKKRTVERRRTKVVLHREDVACTEAKARAYGGSSRAEGDRRNATAAALGTLTARVSDFWFRLVGPY
ncbi:hypothetical protein E1A91_D09G083000v1 [Gossypium mustelinum]|uniref:Uncharacterized protein n=1 Tax=Gossypium mustelinum TaxID=34275 RepID=A0A5D2TGR4_GOSMU|nr:hypothetical protein E1A91_D09G083000v1 [Gossypium mustelinum]